MKTQKHHTSTQTTTATLVLGGNGKTGRRVVEALHAQGRKVRIGSRSASPSFDWNDSSNWGEVLEGVSEMYVAYHPDLAVPGASEHIRELVALAKEKAVRRIVLLSGRGEEEAQLCERIVMHSGVPATVVRCSWFNQNFSESFLRGMVVDGTIALPVSTVREPFVDVNDIADVAVAALTEDGHAGEIYEITGPRLMNFAEVAQEIAVHTGREVRFVEIPMEDFVAGLRAADLPDGMVELIQYLFTQVLDGRNESLGDGVQRALGREPRDFSDFVADAHASRAWDA
ncbi:NmrA family NAD(P)-binding protein [Coraliomargarita algicola]|uniref:NmrA family NAD(P)-binding protein n=1 Tax=Coraliomargarita algicola TaxID=3092156 RepID=A0ABZ0RQW7_9BACT|nr:NmrA family NAD(P)-binding protein [Coraliomargarita sp. J2-16]WPJ97493.1 NmrA family NAD(P)-binding protein [Coraliomargarita sp. J2-16]